MSNMDNKGGKTKYQQQLKAGNKHSSGRALVEKVSSAESSEKSRSRELADEIDGRFGFHRMVDVSLLFLQPSIYLIDNSRFFARYFE